MSFHRLDSWTPYLPPEARRKLIPLRKEIVSAFMEGRMEDWSRAVGEATLLLRLSGMAAPEDIRRLGGKRSHAKRLLRKGRP